MSRTKEATIIAALSTLPSSHLSHLTLSLSAVHRRNLRRLAALLSSPTLFSLSLRHLHSLSRHQKSLLIARHLLSDLTLLQSHLTSSTAPPPFTTTKLRDLDAALLLLLLCELHHHDRDFLGAPPSRWRYVLRDYVSGSILRLPTFGGSSDAETLIQFVDSVRRCWNLVSAMGLAGGSKGGAATAASPAAVVALPSVVVSGGGGECVVCKEEMRDGREVCQLPCGHLFHWVCILPWLKKRDTCPCCRRRLPSDDVRREIQRLLEDLVRIGSGEM